MSISNSSAILILAVARGLQAIELVYTFHDDEALSYYGAKQACKNSNARLVEIFDKQTDLYLQGHVRCSAVEWFVLRNLGPPNLDVYIPMFGFCPRLIPGHFPFSMQAITFKHQVSRQMQWRIVKISNALYKLENARQRRATQSISWSCF